MYYLGKKRKYGQMSQKFTIMDGFFYSYADEAYDKWKACTDKDEFNWKKETRILDYITADIECQLHSWPWVEVDYIYVPCCIKKLSHWVLVVAHLKSRKLMVYDSMSKSKRSHKSVMTHLLRLAEIIPIVLCSINAFDGLGIEDTSSAAFSVEDHDAMPQQENG